MQLRIFLALCPPFFALLTEAAERVITCLDGDIWWPPGFRDMVQIHNYAADKDGCKSNWCLFRSYLNKSLPLSYAPYRYSFGCAPDHMCDNTRTSHSWRFAFDTADGIRVNFYCIISKTAVLWTCCADDSIRRHQLPLLTDVIMGNRRFSGDIGDSVKVYTADIMAETWAEATKISGGDRGALIDAHVDDFVNVLLNVSDVKKEKVKYFLTYINAVLHGKSLGPSMETLVAVVFSPVCVLLLLICICAVCFWRRRKSRRAKQEEFKGIRSMLQVHAQKANVAVPAVAADAYSKEVLRGIEIQEKKTMVQFEYTEGEMSPCDSSASSHMRRNAPRRSRQYQQNGDLSFSPVVARRRPPKLNSRSRTVPGAQGRVGAPHSRLTSKFDLTPGVTSQLWDDSGATMAPPSSSGDARRFSSRSDLQGRRHEKRSAPSAGGNPPRKGTRSTHLSPAGNNGSPVKSSKPTRRKQSAL